MKYLAPLLFTLLSFTVQSQTTYTVGPGQQYLRLQDAYNSIPDVLTGAYEIHLMAGYNSAIDTFPIIFDKRVNASPTNTITIMPQAPGLELVPQNSLYYNTIQFDSCSYVILDGRVGGVGDTANLKVSNALDRKFTIRLDSASYNTIKYCNITSVASEPDDSAMVIMTGGPCTNNLFEKNLLHGDGADVPYHLFYASAQQHNNNTFRNNYIFGCSGTALWIDDDVDDWLVEGNHVFQGNGSKGFNFITVFGDMNNGVVRNNFMGGSGPFCTGAPFGGGTFLNEQSKSEVYNNTFQNWDGESQVAGDVIRGQRVYNNSFSDIRIANDFSVNVDFISAGNYCADISFQNMVFEGNFDIEFVKADTVVGIEVGSLDEVNNLEFTMDNGSVTAILAADIATNNYVGGLSFDHFNPLGANAGITLIGISGAQVNNCIIGSLTVPESIHSKADVSFNFTGFGAGQIQNSTVSNVFIEHEPNYNNPSFTGCNGTATSDCTVRNINAMGDITCFSGTTIVDVLVDSIVGADGSRIKGVSGQNVSNCTITGLYSDFEIKGIRSYSNGTVSGNVLTNLHSEKKCYGIQSDYGVSTGMLAEVSDNLISNLSAGVEYVGNSTDYAYGISCRSRKVINNNMQNFLSYSKLFAIESVDNTGTVIEGNTMSNMKTQTFNGILLSENDGFPVDTIRNNTISNIECDGGYGMWFFGNGSEGINVLVIDNTLENIQVGFQPTSSFVGDFAGIKMEPNFHPTICYARNNIIRSVVSANNRGEIIGISNPRVAANNLITLGIDDNGDATLNQANLIGIYNREGTDLLYNSIYLESNYDTVTQTACIFEYDAQFFNNPLRVVGNILQNNCGNLTNGVGNHHTYFTDHIGAQTFNSNLHYLGGNNGIMIGIEGGYPDQVTFADMQSGFFSHPNSTEGNPLFLNPNGATNDVDMSLNVGSPAFGAGLALPEVTDDYFHQPRSATPTIGAIEGLYVPCAQILTASSCVPYESPSGNYTWSQSGTYLDTIPSPGCDQIYQVNLTITNEVVEVLNASQCAEYESPSGNYTWSMSGTYTDTIFNQLGCDSVFVINLEILEPTTSLIDVADCVSYTTPSGNQTLTTTGIYTDVIPNAAGCDSVITIDFELVEVDTSITQNGTELTSNATNATFQWLNCDQNLLPMTGETNASLSNLLFGTYALEVNQDGCIDTSSCYTIGDVGIEEMLGNLDVRSFPNPTANAVTLEFDHQFTGNMTVFGATGKELFTELIKGRKQFKFELPTAYGMYWIQLSNEKGLLHSFKIVKQ